MANRLRFGALFTSLFLVFSFVAVDYADARRGGSFGSRGGRTFQSAPATQTAPNVTAPVNRTMTQPSAAQPGAAARQPGAQAQRGGLFGGLGGGLLGGLLLGGMFGMLMGTGFGGMGGFLALLVQLLLVGLGAMLLIRLFRGRSAPTPARASAGDGSRNERRAYQDSPPAAGAGSFRIPSIGSGAGAAAGAAGAKAAATPVASGSDEVGITDEDLETFEQRLVAVQAAFSREDYAALRQLTTPEVMSYLAEELSDNATSGRKNDVLDVKLEQGDLAEAWREGPSDYASVAMRFSSIDVMRDRTTGEVVEGNPETPTEATELWTFVRERGGDWKLSAIQEA
ncbi:MAG: Tim44 domain-containing protein [Aurantimonas endophytica]|uniref:Putative lipid-binding transport protein (Tim44 family) n=2 Tax=Aurantimonas endophytica TaxID=1522175 RepID=A0A7W6HBV0_9HYPH|nr:Tim44 domain-containing protein [Aurantimonas endophytica]MBB4002288.1 putative lipid-binding transport protein (Tim44 family) [Aurantimonas endophytica]MCO6402088.1 TIM44-like domain-containing protein [Aurantimonas endophytica]